MDQPFQIRPAQASDLSFIYTTWLHGLYHSAPWWKEVSKTIFWANYRRVIEIILTHAEVNVACVPESPDVVLGYVVHTGPVLHWMFTKKAFRRLGIAKALLPTTISDYTHITDIGRSLKQPGWTYNPFLVGPTNGN